MSKINRTENDLENLFLKSKKILEQLGYIVNININNISLNKRLSSTIGRYFPHKKSIEINYNYFLYAHEHDIINTMIHEIIHDLAPGCNHNGKWFEIAADVSNRSIYLIEENAREEELHGISPKPENEHRVKFKYEHKFKCKCGYEKSVRSKFENLLQRYIPTCILTGLYDEEHNMDFLGVKKVYKYL